MKLHGTMQINERGHLEIGGCDAVDLVAAFGSRLMVIDDALLREDCRRYRKAFAHDDTVAVFYASKALLTTVVEGIAFSIDEVMDQLFARIQTNPDGLSFKDIFKTTSGDGFL